MVAQDAVTLVFGMLNELKDDKISKLSETSSVGQEIIALCNRLSEFHRPMPCVGGTSDIWKHNNPGRGAMVEKMVTIARSMWIPTITGQRYLKPLHYG